MKPVSESKALVKLRRIKDEYREAVRKDYEHKAKSCITCETPGACCRDAHFVNVHVTRLEAAAMNEVLSALPASIRGRVRERVENTIEKYRLSAENDTFAQTYACPLFEAGVGCLVHKDAKPLPCIHHACYEKGQDLPPDAMLTEREEMVGRLNELTYRNVNWLPIPIWLKNLNENRQTEG